MADQVNARGGNLYGPRTLQGNWYEDRFQGTIGTNDGLRCIDTAYKEMMEGASTFAGLSDEVSMPATQFGNVTTQEPSVNLFPCLKYRHPKQLPTHRVLAAYEVSPALRMTTTSMLMNHGEKRLYLGDPRRKVLDSTNMREALATRPTSLPEQGFGAIVPRFESDQDLGKRHWETASRNDWTDKSAVRPRSPPCAPPSNHPIPHPKTVTDDNKGHREDAGAGFNYDPATTFNPMPFPAKGVDGGDPWGRKAVEKKDHFGRHHITSTTVLFRDARGFDKDRLGITIPNDTTMWPRDECNPAPKRRQTLIAFGQRENLTRRTGAHIWDDWNGR